MRTLFAILLLTSITAQAQKRIPVYPGKDSMVYCMDVMKTYNPQADDTLVIMNNSRYIKGIKMEQLCGTPLHPIVVTFENPAKPIGGYPGYAFSVARLANVTFQNLYIDGLGKSNSCFAIGQFQHIILENFVFKNAFAFGLGIKTDYSPNYRSITTFPQVNTDITVRYGKIENTGAEGAYIGTSKVRRDDSTIHVPIIGLTVQDLQTTHTGWDGIQFSNVQNLKAKNLTISDYGYKNTTYQKNGLVVGSAVTFADTMHHVSITNGTGAGLIVLGKGKLPFKNVVVSGVTVAGESGVYIDDYDAPFDFPPQQISFDSLRVQNVANAPIYVVNKLKTALPIQVHNYLFTGAAAALYDATKGFFTNDTVIVPPVVVTPVDTVAAPVVVPVADDTLRITASADYTVKPTAMKQVIITTKKLKIYLPDSPPDGFYVKIINKAYPLTITLSKRSYFTNGKYRTSVKRMMADQWKKAKSKYYIKDKLD